MFSFKPSLRRLLMTLEDRIEALQGSVVSLTNAVTALEVKVSSVSAPAAASVDFTPVLSAIADIKAQLLPTPQPVPTPTPVEAPAAPATAA